VEEENLQFTSVPAIVSRFGNRRSDGGAAASRCAGYQIPAQRQGAERCFQQMKFTFLFIVLIASAGFVKSEETATTQSKHKSKHKVDGSNALWDVITFPAASLPVLFSLSRQEDGFGLTLNAGEQYLKEGKISVRLHYASGQTVSPEWTPAESMVLAGSFGGSWSSMVVFPWGKNILEEAWIEVSTESGRIWLEIPYGFTRDPKAPNPPPTFDGDARFASAMKHLARQKKTIHLSQFSQSISFSGVDVSKARDVILHWAKVQYDSFPIQKGWRLSFTKWNIIEEAGEEVELYREDKRNRPWDLHSPRTALRLIENSGHALASTCMGIRVHNGNMSRSDSFSINGGSNERDDRRSWEKVEIDVEDKTYSIMIPSSLFKHSHGTTSWGSKTW
jgi:hypothetical protein